MKLSFLFLHDLLYLMTVCYKRTRVLFDIIIHTLFINMTTKIKQLV